MTIERFEMERYQSLYWHLVDYDLSESGVSPMTIAELLGSEAASFVDSPLGYPLSEGSHESRAAIAEWYPEATAENVTMMNGGSEANLLTLWSLLESGDRLAFMVPNYCQALGLGPMFADAVDTFRLARDGDRWALDLESLDRAVGQATKVVMVCNPNNPTGAVLSEAEMEAVIEVAAKARRLDRRRRDLPRRRGRHRRHVAHVLGPPRQGRDHERPVEGVRDARSAGRMGGRAQRRDRADLGAARLHHPDTRRLE